MGMARNCNNCTEKCPQAELAHQTALGRMYATKEFTALLKKVESGELVEVVHGSWIVIDHDGSWRVDKCSRCHKRMHYADYDQPYPYCPNCGADMR